MTALAVAGAARSFLLSPPQISKSPTCSSFSFLKPKQLNRNQSIPAYLRRVSSAGGPVAVPSCDAATSGIYSAKVYDLSAENVNLVLDDVRPYLIADGGNVDVVSVEDGIISLQLQARVALGRRRRLKIQARRGSSTGWRSSLPKINDRLCRASQPLLDLADESRGACGSCPSSTTTMKMGIERVLKEKFGEAVKEIRQVSDAPKNTVTTAEAVNGHLDILRHAIGNYGGTVQVVSVEGGDCHVRYVGPDSIGSGIRAAIKERFPDIVNVVFTS